MNPGSGVPREPRILLPPAFLSRLNTHFSFHHFRFGFGAEGQTCVADSNCDSGLHCETCVANGNLRPRCTRIQRVNPTSKVDGLPFNRYLWLTTHNSFARLGERSTTGFLILAPSNQQDFITSQLDVCILILYLGCFQSD
ncbi:hypothetical protein SLA2020_032580 [Shorea laevis]